MVWHFAIRCRGLNCNYPTVRNLSCLGVAAISLACFGLKKGMIRRQKSGEYRLYSRKRNPGTGKRRNLGTFETLEAAKRHERQVQFFKRH